MKHRITLATLPLLLTACTTAYQADEQALLDNPLYLEILSEQMVDTLVNLEIYEDPILEDPEVKKVSDDTREIWFARAKEARKLQREGSKGTLVGTKEYVEGEVLYAKNLVHFGPTFVSAPGPSLHVFLSKTIDPREGDFPGDISIDLGQIRNPFGAQSFFIPEAIDNPLEYRTVVLYDTKLKRIYGFAQINPLYL